MDLKNTATTNTAVQITKLKYQNKICILKKLFLKSNFETNILKEIKIHKKMNHKHIIKLITHFTNENYHGMVLEYGEYCLRSMIHPDIGLQPAVSQMFFKQLMSAVRYLHEHGICHRDIKPENILVTKEGNLKVCDFGHATLFYYKETRKLKKVAGSYEFMAPEVLKMEYDGAAADIWSCGITLLNMISGKLPWRMAAKKDEKYLRYKTCNELEGFRNVRKEIMELISNMLKDEKERVGINEIEKNKWFCQNNTLMDEDGLCINGNWIDGMSEWISDLNYTQPSEIGARNCFVPASVPIQSNGLQTMYNIYINNKLEVVRKKIREALDKMVVSCKEYEDYILYSTIDTKKNRLCGEIVIKEIAKKTRVTFKRTNGDLGEFQKFVVYLRENFFDQN